MTVDPEVRPLGSLLRRPPRYGINAAAVAVGCGNHAYLRITDIDEFGRFAPRPRVEVRHPHANDYILMPGQLVFARTGASVGKSYLYDPADGDLVYAGFLINVEPDPRRLNARYLAAYVRSQQYWDWVASISARSGQPGINGQEYAQLPIPVPDMRVQTAIAYIATNVNTQIVALERAIAKNERIKQGMMQRLLSGATRLPGYTGDWRETSLRDDVTLVSGHHVLAEHCNTRGLGVPYLTGPADFPRGCIRQTKFTEYPGTFCQAGDILVTVKGSGAGALVEADARYCISRQLMAIRPNTWNSRFLLYSLLHKAAGIANATTGLIPGLSRSDLVNLEVAVPPLREQRAIAAVLGDTDSTISALRDRLAKTKSIEQGMMQQLLTGRARLSVMEAMA